MSTPRPATDHVNRQRGRRHHILNTSTLTLIMGAAAAAGMALEGVAVLLILAGTR